MRRWLGRSALVALVFALCWGGAVWYWRATNRMPAAGDLALYLLVLPMALLLAIWIGRRLIAAAPAAAASSDPANAGDAAPPPLPATAPLAIVDAALRLPHADSAAELADAFAAARTRPALDPELVDNNGYPVMTARAASAVDNALKAAFLAWLAEHGHTDIAPSPAQWRALTMAAGVVADLAGPAAGDWIAADDAVPLLRLVALLPPDWPAPLRLAAAQWLGHTAAQAGWPAAHISAAPDITVDGGAPALLQRIGALPADGPVLTLLVACASYLAQASVDAWADSDTLFTASTPHGLIPGEGAAALLLTDPLHASRHGAHTLLHAAMPERRAQSADATKRVDASLLARLAEQAMTSSLAAPASVGLVVADSGPRVNRVLEVAAVLDAAVPHLDAGDDVFAIGAASGACGAVPFIAALALAHQQAGARNAPVLCLANDDPHYRCAALIGPAAIAS